MKCPETKVLAKKVEQQLVGLSYSPFSFAFVPYILPYDTSIEEKAVFYDDCA